MPFVPVEARPDDRGCGFVLGESGCLFMADGSPVVLEVSAVAQPSLGASPASQHAVAIQLLDENRNRVIARCSDATQPIASCTTTTAPIAQGMILRCIADLPDTSYSTAAYLCANKSAREDGTMTMPDQAQLFTGTRTHAIRLYAINVAGLSRFELQTYREESTTGDSIVQVGLTARRTVFEGTRKIEYVEYGGGTRSFARLTFNSLTSEARLYGRHVSTSLVTTTYERSGKGWRQVSAVGRSSTMQIDLTMTGVGDPRMTPYVWPGLQCATFPIFCPPGAVTDWWRKADVSGTITLGGLKRTLPNPLGRKGALLYTI
jgi:hypothetical protein